MQRVVETLESYGTVRRTKRSPQKTHANALRQQPRPALHREHEPSHLHDTVTAESYG